MNNQVWATERLRERREALGLSQVAMREFICAMAEIEMSDSTYQKWESQKISLSGLTALKISAVVEIPFDMLFQRKEPVTKS